MKFPAQNCPSEITIIGEVSTRFLISPFHTIIKQASPLMILLFVTRAPHPIPTKGASHTAQPTQHCTSRSEKGVVEPVKKL